jgi:hypothetical protein
MQYLNKMIFSFVVVVSLIGSLTLLGCGGDDEEMRNVSSAIPLNATNAAAVNGTTFPGVSGTVLAQNAVPAAPQLQNQTVSVAFSGVSGATGNFTMTAPNVTVSGTTRFASCTFTVATTSNAAVVAVGTVITIANCNVNVTATAVEVGGTTGTTGTATLSLNGSSSQSVPTTVTLQDNGTIVITNGAGTAIVTGVITTGTTGG